jgi:predicted ester cyclase
MIIRRHHDAINRGDLAKAAADYAETVLNNGHASTRTRIAAVIEDNARTFPDWNMHIDHLIAKGDTVVVLMTVSGTHKGVSQTTANGGAYYGVAPTGRHFSVLHSHWFKLQNGRIVEHQATRDDLEMSRQLGLLPPKPQRQP